MQRFVVFVAGLVMLIALLPAWSAPAALAQHAALAHAAGTTRAAAPAFDPGNFPHSTIINNLYFPLTPGTTYTYQGTSDGAIFTEEFVVTNKVKTILGVDSVTVMDTDALTGSVVETTLDWYAQDKFGDVWYMGEYATQFTNGKVSGHAGSWLGGVGDGRPGVVMLAHPDAGDAYTQESDPGVAQDRAKVLSVRASSCVPYDCYYRDVVKTAETSPLAPGEVELKYSAPGIGVVQSAIVRGGVEQIQLIKITH